MRISPRKPERQRIDMSGYINVPSVRSCSMGSGRPRNMRFRSKSFAMAIPTAIVAVGVFAVVVTQRATPVSAADQPASARIAGKPDLSGIWEANNTANWDLQTHEARPMVAQQGLTPNSVVLAAPVLALGSIGWVPPGLGIVEGEEIP